MVEFEPPRIACIVAETDYSFTALNQTSECVIAIPPYDIARKVVDIGSCHGDTDKFAAFGLTIKPGRQVKAPLITEYFATRVQCDRSHSRHAYNLFILEVVKAWIDPKRKDIRRSIIEAMENLR